MKQLFFSFVSIFVFTFGFAQTVKKISYDDSLIIARTAEMKCLMTVFKAKKPNEDSAFAANYCFDHVYHLAYYHEGTYPKFTDSDFEKAKKGDVIGPYPGDGWMTIYKIVDKKKSSDSVQVRHILVTYHGAERADPAITRTKKQAKERADSICKLITSGKMKMEDLVTKELTDDLGSVSGNKGNYGWFSKESGFVKPFRDYGFDNPVGKTMVIETEFGYHIMQVVAKSPEFLCAETIIVARKIDNDKHWEDIDSYIMPEYPGGQAALSRYIRENIRYPENERKNHIEAAVLVSFSVDSTGNVINIAVDNKESVPPSFAKEAQRLIVALPRWKPGYKKTDKGLVPIGVSYDLFVEFLLDDCDEK